MPHKRTLKYAIFSSIACKLIVTGVGCKKSLNVCCTKYLRDQTPGYDFSLIPEIKSYNFLNTNQISQSDIKHTYCVIFSNQFFTSSQ